MLTVTGKREWTTDDFSTLVSAIKSIGGRRVKMSQKIVKSTTSPMMRVTFSFFLPMNSAKPETTTDHPEAISDYIDRQPYP